MTKTQTQPFAKITILLSFFVALIHGDIGILITRLNRAQTSCPHHLGQTGVVINSNLQCRHRQLGK